jgi:hypothetical protein
MVTFIDKSQYAEVVDLFSDDGEVWFLGGIYKGKAGIRRLYIERFRNNFTEGHNGPRYGWLLDHLQIQMIVDVAPDRRTASVRGRSLMQAGLHETASGHQRAWWEGGTYENRYVRENGVWKIPAPRLLPALARQFPGRLGEDATRFRPDGERHVSGGSARSRCTARPDAAPVACDRYRAFHYEHPVTGKPIEIDNRRAREGFKDG